MKKCEIFENNISWLAKKKDIDETVECIKKNLELYDEKSDRKGVAASNVALYGSELRRKCKEFEELENVLISEFKYVNPDIEIEDDDEDELF